MAQNTRSKTASRKYEDKMTLTDTQQVVEMYGTHSDVNHTEQQIKKAKLTAPSDGSATALASSHNSSPMDLTQDHPFSYENNQQSGDHPNLDSPKPMVVDQISPTISNMDQQNNS